MFCKNGDLFKISTSIVKKMEFNGFCLINCLLTRNVIIEKILNHKIKIKQYKKTNQRQKLNSKLINTKNKN